MRGVPVSARRLLALGLLASLAACARAPEPLRISGPTMGTTYSVVVTELPDGISRGQVEQVIAQVLDDADRHLSVWNPDGELVRFNANASTEWQAVSEPLHSAIAQALEVGEASGGAFDITVGPLVAAWGFGAGAGIEWSAPDADEIGRMLDRTGWSQLELRESPPMLRKRLPELTIDLDGIAPGWAVDRIAERFDALGLRDYLVELGGEVRGRGSSPERRRWRVAVEAPILGTRRPLAVIELDGVGVSTSGDYRDFRELDGRRVSHTIDPRTGRPVEHQLASVTVVHPSVAGADAWATALMVLGAEEGLARAGRRGLAAFFVVRDASGELTETETPEFTRLRARESARL